MNLSVPSSSSTPLGIDARQTDLALVPVMAVAAWVQLPNGGVHTRTGGWESPVFLIAAALHTEGTMN